MTDGYKGEHAARAGYFCQLMQHAGAIVQILITNRHVKLTRLLREHIETRVGLALGRFADRITVVSVKFAKGNSNGKTPENRCHIEVSLRKKIRVEAAHSDVLAAVDRALDYATRSVARALNHENDAE
jgi:ribosomal subunit interface protein